ncbi:Fe-S oxidoreductase [Pedobacter antarcticus 4BY]|uniref:Fe-S oxidoreductase n=2 Tax=Pedobacter antarcticus TaxID=34086 RepID=A0A081PHC2_9SPHI|nr:4Fe-4S dicluster domain-containing protein [Pedobacter antarcticus]KEQ30095.1 Fe-S oxidoreductase [Pedobacter antarcticus 4BY]SFF46899.1 4Fe-4S double cluster binding domain-containing protein [Pedobacter antarcticus]
MISQILFIAITIAAVILFSINVKKVIRNIRLGRDADRSDQPSKRLITMLKVAFGQSKMVVRPIPAALHFVVYAGFVIINIEVLEIMIDGIFGTHRIFGGLGTLYNFLIGSFEILALGVWLACVIFLIRRNILKLKRFMASELEGWPKSDANYILFTEVLLMTAFLLMNAADAKLQTLGVSHYTTAGSFPVSQFLIPLLPDQPSALIALERGCWWFHIIGILAFLNYLPYSKHFHILFAFPNTYYSNLEPKGEFTNMQSVTNEVKAMLDPSFVPAEAAAGRFGAKDVNDLTWINLMNAYTCTECGRCTSVCPANITGKLLSPRKIMMDTRDRMEEVGKSLDQKGPGLEDGKSLIDDYITREEIWACTSCNACVEACPINIDPLAIITELRRYAVMEESQAPSSINTMLGNIENNGAPWKYSPADRFNWAKEN